MDEIAEIMDFFSKDSIEELNKIEEAKKNKDISKEIPIEYIIEKSPLEIKKENLENLRKEGFNEQQINVIESDYPIVNIAGPGSGKTKTLIAKIINQVNNENDLRNLLILTFTNAASNEILERLSKKLNKELDRRDFYAGTYHGIFYKIIKENYEALKIFGFTGVPRILDSNDEKHLFESIVYMVLDKDSVNKKKDLKEEFESEHGFMPLDVYYQINSLINAIPKSIKDIKEKVIARSISQNSFDLENLEKIVHTFFKFKIENNFFGFGDILMYMNFLLEKDEIFKEKIKNQFKNILVDEYQDTNPIQEKILYFLEKNDNRCNIGDPYQSIYRFLGASVKNIVNKSKLEGMNTIQLTTNYRSTPNIVEFTNDVSKLFNDKVNNYVPCISGNKILNNLKVGLKEGINQEYNVLNDVKMRLNQGIELKDMAVLVRTKFETYKLEAILKREKIPFIKLGGNELYESKEVKFMIDLAKIVSGQYTLNNFQNVAAKYKGLGTTTVEKFVTTYLSKGSKIDIKDLIDQEFSNSKTLKGFSDLIFGNVSKADKENLFFESKETDIIRDCSINTFKDIMIKMDIENQLIKDADTNNKKKEIETNIKYFYEELSSYFEKGKEELIDFLADISLGQNDVEKVEDENALVISTIHGAKGKEWQDVYVLNVQDGKFPSLKSMNIDLDENEREALMEEEKRLLYVAISRAKEKLVLMSEGELNSFVKPLTKKHYVNYYKKQNY